MGTIVIATYHVKNGVWPLFWSACRRPNGSGQKKKPVFTGFFEGKIWFPRGDELRPQKGTKQIPLRASMSLRQLANQREHGQVHRYHDRPDSNSQESN